MGKRGSLRAALAIIGAVSGTACASGRELVLFFGQLGSASWLGMALAGALFGLLMGLLCRRAARLGAADTTAYCMRLPGAARWMLALLQALAAWALLRAAGRLGELTLPFEHGFAWGVALALLAALALNLTGLRAMPWLGLAALAFGLAFYGGLALDPRPVRVHMAGEVSLALEGSVPALALLAAAFASMNACVASPVALRFAGRDMRPWRLGALCGGMLCALLACALAAIARGGRQLLAQALPTVILSARWGIWGFWLCALFGFLCATASLAAVLSGLAAAGMLKFNPFRQKR